MLQICSVTATIVASPRWRSARRHQHTIGRFTTPSRRRQHASIGFLGNHFQCRVGSALMLVTVGSTSSDPKH